MDLPMATYVSFSAQMSLARRAATNQARAKRSVALGRRPVQPPSPDTGATVRTECFVLAGLRGCTLALSPMIQNVELIGHGSARFFQVANGPRDFGILHVARRVIF